MTSQSIERRGDFSDFEMLDAQIFSSVHIRRRVSVEEQRAQKYDRVLRRRQIAYMIYEQFRAIGAHEAVQRLSDLFFLRSQHDDVQDFEQRMSWKVYTSQNCRILFKFRQRWLCMNKRMFETTNHQAIPD